MKAIRVEQFGEPDVLKLAELPLPTIGAGQVLVRVHAAGVNPVDTYIRAGTYAKKPPLPYTPGSDAAGLVEAVGEKVLRVKPGDRVYTAGSITGAYAEFAACEEVQVYPLPANTSFVQGAALGVPYATAFHALVQRARAIAGETVLVHGASGGVGTAAVQIARARGLRVFGTAGTERGRRLVLEQGAHHVFDHRGTHYLEQVREATGGRGVDVILEMLANVNLGKDLAILGLRGRVAIIGNRGRVEIDPRDLMSRRAEAIGVMLGQATPEELSSIHAALYAGLENETLRPVVGNEWALVEASQAHRAVMVEAHGKNVLIP